MTPTKENKGPQKEFTFGEGVLLTPLGQNVGHIVP